MHAAFSNTAEFKQLSPVAACHYGLICLSHFSEFTHESMSEAKEVPPPCENVLTVNSAGWYTAECNKHASVVCEINITYLLSVGYRVCNTVT